MDMVNNQIPTFEDKAEALHYFPLFRTWFGLIGLCKLPWNDVEPADNAKHGKEPAKVPSTCRTTWSSTRASPGKRDDEGRPDPSSPRRSTTSSACSTCAWATGGRQSDWPPYRSVGPVTREEYESRAERYDKQLKELIGVDPAGKTTDEKMALHRACREDRYSQLCDAVYKRRGWTTTASRRSRRSRSSGSTFPEVVEVVKEAGVTE